jgi:hypothetical protein
MSRPELDDAYRVMAERRAALDTDALLEGRVDPRLLLVGLDLDLDAVMRLGLVHAEEVVESLVGAAAPIGAVLAGSWTDGLVVGVTYERMRRPEPDAGPLADPRVALDEEVRRRLISAAARAGKLPDYADAAHAVDAVLEELVRIGGKR